MANPATSKKDFLSLLILFVVAFLIFFRIFSAEYVYTDENVELWLYRPGSDFHMFLEQGRFMTELFSRWLFEPVTTVKGLTALRLFPFIGWIVSIPVWYFVIKKITLQEGLPTVLPFFTTLYLISTPTFAISIGWLAVLGIFLANTAGLLSGYFLYTAINYKGKSIVKSIVCILFAILAGLVSLSSYQSGFGCFLLPFIMHLAAANREQPDYRRIAMGFVGCIMIYGIYYLLFRLSLSLNDIAPSNRAGIQLKPIGKLKFLFTRALPTSFHFSWLVNERSIAGLIQYAVFFAATFLAIFFQKKAWPFLQRIRYILAILLFFVFAYLPSLVVRENYASNRTILALNMVVFVLVAIVILNFCKTAARQRIFTAIGSVYFVIVGWYNFNKAFLDPAVHEYKLLRNYVSANYQPGQSVYFIRPEEDFFERKYGVQRSWDEFGVPSSFFAWVPAAFVKQTVFEKTGDRAAADAIPVKDWLGQKEYQRSGLTPGADVLVVDAERILSEAN